MYPFTVDKLFLKVKVSWPTDSQLKYMKTKTFRHFPLGGHTTLNTM
jgi:hypothetical protein